LHLRHPFDLGGLYFIFNAIMNMLSVLVSAIVYSVYVPSANSSASHSFANDTAANSTHATVSFSKIDDLPLFVSAVTLVVVWAISAAALVLTSNRKYVRTFVSTQTGSAYACNAFLDHEGNDSIRIHIFLFSERKWRSIRDRVKQWVCSFYAVWEQVRPTWFNESLKASIPDDFLPSQVLVQLNAQAPGGRRKSVAEMGVVRRMSLSAFADVVPASDDDEYQTMPEELPRDLDAANHADAMQSNNRHSGCRIEPKAASSAKDSAGFAAGLDNSVRVVDLEA
jgi:hypothetical protein